MIAGRLIHPPLLAALAAAGHGATVLVCDAHYPASTRVGRHARVVHLGLTPGVPDAATVLDVLLDVLPVEGAAVMAVPGGGDSAATAGFRERLAGVAGGVPVEALERDPFYAEATSDDLAVVVVTADVRQYANLLLRVGVLGVPAAASAASLPVL